MELGNEDYNPPIVHTEAFEVTKYKFNNGYSLICVSGKSNETLSLGRKNGSRFWKMIMEEMEETLRDDGEDSVDETIQKLRGNSRDRLDSYSFGNFAEIATTATVRIVDNGEQEITAMVDGKEFTITEASVRRHLQLADVDAEEGEGSGNPFEPQPSPSTAQHTHEEPIPNIESSSPQKTQSPRQALNKDTELPQTSVPIPYVPYEVVHQERGDSVERAATAATSLEAMRDSSNIAKTQSTATPTDPIS
ncbi:hypothetical protein Tco_0740804 [Tanacetum coccineum]